MRHDNKSLTQWITFLGIAFLTVLTASPVQSAPLPGGTLDPTIIPKYVTPLVIPPQMPKSVSSPAPSADYDIAVRQFKQQILPGGIWNTLNNRTDNFGATTVWSYGRASDPLPDSSGIGGAVGVAPATNSTFNYPAFTVEAASAVPTSVRWINDLVDPVSGNFLPHLFPVDQTLHWANPPKANCAMGTPNRTDCETMMADPYTGPVPLVTHVHGAHVQPDSDGYPEAWWLPGAPGTKGIPASYAQRGSVFTQANNANTVAGSAYYSYENTQPATTLWYHDHALGMTRLNVYAGPAGFWLIRGGANGDGEIDRFSTVAPKDGILPGPAPTLAGGDPNFTPAVRNVIREIPIAIQDRSFNSNGSLFYPLDRSFFDSFFGPYIGGIGTPVGPSDISGIWNPEAFFNTMVVNGTTWPILETSPARYRLRLLNGCNSRTLNLSLFVVNNSGLDGVFGTADDVLGAEIPIYQIGSDQGFLPKVVKIQTGSVTTLPGNNTVPAAVQLPLSEQARALLMGPAERADVIVDFSGLGNDTRIRLINTAPDAPFGGFPDVAADPSTTGQVMEFIIKTALIKPGDALTTPPEDLVLPAEGRLPAADNTRMVSLNELVSDQVCIEIDPAGAIVGTLFSRSTTDPNFSTFLADCLAATPVNPNNTTDVMGPRQAQLGIMTIDQQTGNLLPQTKKWGDAITEYPLLNSTEIWEIYNTTVDAHPIHLHLVRYEVINRQDLDPVTLLPVPGTESLPNPNETGYKDTVVAFPGQVTRIKAKFDIAGLYVWHCHIVEHEDNEMMRPFIVTAPPTGATLSADVASPQIGGATVTFTAAGVGGSGPYEYEFWRHDGTNWSKVQAYSTSNTFVWNTTAATPAAFYTVQVNVRNAGSTAAFNTVNGIIFQIVPPAATGATLTPDKSSPQAKSTVGGVTFNAAGQGGSGSYEFEFWMHNGTSWSKVRDYLATSSWNWDTTTATAGAVYTIQVNVRSVGSTAAYEAYNAVNFIVTTIAAASGATLTPDKSSPQPQNTPGGVTFNAGGQGGSGSYEFEFWMHNGTSWSKVQNYSAISSYNWNTLTAVPGAVYTFQVNVRNAGSTAAFEASQSINYIVTAGPATGATLTPNKISPQPLATVGTVTFSATGQGGSGSYEFEFWLHNGTSWALQQGYSPTANWNWNAAAGSTGIVYTIQVNVRNAGSTDAFQASQALNFILQ